jgi:hypothetical protein
MVAVVGCFLGGALVGQAQTDSVAWNQITGIWVLDDIQSVKAVQIKAIDTVEVEELRQTLLFSCPDIIEMLTKDEIIFHLYNNTKIKIISYSLIGNKLTLSLFPGHTLVYEWRRVKNSLTLSHTVKSFDAGSKEIAIDYTYTYNLK